MQPLGIFFVMMIKGERGVLMIKVCIIWLLLVTFLVAACSGMPRKKENLPAVRIAKK